MSHHDPRALERARAQFFRRQGARPPGRVFPPGTERVPTLPREELPVGPAVGANPPPPTPGAPPAFAQPAPASRTPATPEAERHLAALPAPPKRIAMPEGHMEWLRLDTLKPWRDQRPISDAALRRMARDYRAGRLTPPMVSRRADGDYVLDGNHRWHFLAKLLDMGDHEVQCLVYEGLTDAEENELFLSQAPGMRRPLSALHGFAVEVKNREPQALRIVATVERCGLHMAWTGGAGENGVAAVRALEDIAEDGLDRLERALILAREALGPEPQAYVGDMLLGLAAFLVRFEHDPDYDRAHLVRRLQLFGHKGIIREAREYRAHHGGSQVTAIGRIVLREHDHGKRKKLGEWKTNARSGDQQLRREQRAGEGAA